MEARPVDADVLIAGGGPGGGAAAIACAMRGLRVILCERERFTKERPGETLHPGIEPLLAQLGVSDRLAGVVGARHPGIWIEWGGPRRFEAFGGDSDGPWNGFQAWRADFDALLLERALELGVEIRQPCAIGGLRKQDDARSVIETSQGPVAARMLIDATGRTRWLGRALGIASPARSLPLYARYGYAEGACPARDEAPALAADKSGWTWTAMVRPNLYQWTRLAFDGTQPGAEWLPEEFRGLKPRGASRGADVTWRLANETAGPGWFIVGDAAALLDPASSHGVLRAIMSGMMAAHLSEAVLSGKAPAAEASAMYCRWLADWFEADSTALARFYNELGASIRAPAQASAASVERSAPAA
jgi:flavin-dependent dehydrogenase